MSPTIIRPHIREDPDIVSELEKQLKDEKKVPEEPETVVEEVEVTTEKKVKRLFDHEPGSPESYIKLPKGKYGGREYPDLYIGMDLVSATDKRINNQNFGLILNIDSKDNDQGYLGYISHVQALEIVTEIGGYVPSVLITREFLKLVVKGKSVVSDVIDGAGKIVAPDALEKVYKSMVISGPSWRAEWLSDSYSRGVMGLNVSTFVPDGDQLKREKMNLGMKYLRGLIKGKGIDFDNWLKRSTKHGLPDIFTTLGSFSYASPKKNCAATIHSDNFAGLVCCRPPSMRADHIGVREVRVYDWKK